MNFIISYKTPKIKEYEFQDTSECKIIKIDLQESYQFYYKQKCHVLFEYLGLEHGITFTKNDITLQDILDEVRQSLESINHKIEEESK